MIDESIRLHDPMRRFLRQAVHEGGKIAESWQSLHAAMNGKEKAK